MTLAAITMTAPEAASPVQMYRATYSPDDNKLRLYAASRLDPETYKKVHDAGFRWAPKQALFVAPAWTPGREDVLLSLAGEIEDEDSTLAERQEARAERFTGYSGKRASESAQALDEVERLAAMIPPGQPILVGHHSERRARRDAQRIENGMKRAVMLFERAEYWEERARSALLHAKYKERPDVRWRRIKKIEADLRKAEKTIAQSQKYLTMWRAESLDLNMAKLISSHDHISACFPLDTYPRPAEKSQYEGSRSLWSALDDDIITTEQAREIAIRCHERQIQHQQRWVNHYQNRLIYERAMLDESGGVVTRTQDFEPGGQVFSRGEWLTIIRVNKSNGAVSSVTTPNYSFLGYSGTMKVTPDRITDYKAPSAEEAAVASQAAKRPPVVNYPGEGFREMTKAQWAALPRDCKAVRSVEEAEDHGAYRYRRTMDNNFRLVTLAEISNRDHILEPSAGTGAILRAIRDTAPEAMCDAVEINSGLVRYLRENFNGVRVQCGDFMEWQSVQYYSRIIMNPPFSHGQDIRHILRAFSLLRPGGVLVAVCLNGPRQQEKLLPFSDVREELPRGTFAYTDVPTMIIRLRA